MAETFDAVVVGSGPNGLTAALTLARAGKRVLVLEAGSTPGGGARTCQLTLPGFHHDVCSAIHPLAAASPVFRELGLHQRLRFLHPEVPLAHPLDEGPAAGLFQSMEQTAATLGVDGAAWVRLMRPFVERADDFISLLLNPLLRVPDAPFFAARFGMLALQSAYWLAEEQFEAPAAKALFAGCAAHSFSALDAPLTASFGFALAVTGHAVGWPVIEGGSQALTDALVAMLREAGGEVRCEAPVDSLVQFDGVRAVLFDTSPAQVSAIAQHALPPRWHRAAGRFRRGLAAFKLDYALSGPMPWRDPLCRRAGTVHLGGELAGLLASEAAAIRGEVAEAPYVLVAQQSLVDATRAPAGKHTLWAYCHVPNGCQVDMTSRIEAQLERFAPGWRDLVLAKVATSPAQLQAYNANYAGGDISAGSVEGQQLLLRPYPSLNPWALPNPRLYLCSASTPPGPGVHGMSGLHAAKAALRRSFA